jgi:hypothetical protein
MALRPHTRHAAAAGADGVRCIEASRQRRPPTDSRRRLRLLSISGHIARLTRRRQRSRVAITSALLIALYVGLSVLVIGAGIALSLGASAPDTVLGFAILVRRCRLGLGTAATPALSLGASRSEPIWFSLHPATSCQ